MKQLLFLLLFPCLCVAQYPGNAGQKITLGEQTTADGLVFRGNAADTVAATLKITKTNKSDTSAFLLLDTINNVFLKYNIGTTFWTRLNILPTDTASMLGNYWRSGKFSGVLPVANGGTNASTFTAGSVVFAGASGTSLTQDNANLFWDDSNNRLGVGTSSPINTLDIKTATNKHVLFSNANGQPELLATTDGGAAFIPLYFSGSVFCLNPFNASNVGIGTASPSEILHVVGNARITAVGAGAYANDLNITSTGVLTTASSDEKYKYNILPINYGLNTILQLKPVNFQWIKGEENDLGFIAQDVADIIPEAVDTNWKSDLLMRYESIIPILTKAIQEQNALIKALEQRILILENK